MSAPDHPPAVVVLGDVVTDIIVRLREPISVASDTRAAIDVHPGGSGANQAAWLATTGLAVHYIGRIGRDSFGAYHEGELRRVGVVPHLTVDPDRSTGLIVALVDLAGERSMLTDRGANLGLRVHDLPAELFRPGACFHMSGYTLFEPETREVGLAALDLARARGMTISVDPSSASLLEDIGPERFLSWTRGAHLCFPNLDEGRLLSHESDPEAIARALCPRYGGVALKLGESGALWACDDQPVLVLPAEPIKVVDSTGAGDAFCAGFLERWLNGYGALEALARGIRLSAVAASQVGARPRPV